MSNVVKDLGSLDGELLVFGGVYSNLQALEELQSIAEKRGLKPNSVICTGDIVGYCAQPEEVVSLVRNWGINVIAGNVELQLASGSEDCGCDFSEGGRCDTFSRQWYPYAQSKMSEDQIEWMKLLPEHLVFRYHDRKVVVVHGSWKATSEFIFKSSDWAVKRETFNATNADVVLAGHCGLPFFDLNEGKFWLNSGVIGMPANDGSSKVWYMLIKVDKNDQLIVEHHSYLYDHNKAASLMEENNLPKAYANTLRTGIWDNCEILPDQETLEQGKTIKF